MRILLLLFIFFNVMSMIPNDIPYTDGGKKKNPSSVNITAPGISIRNIRNVKDFAKVRGKIILIRPGSHLTAKELSQGPCWENTEIFRHRNLLFL